MTKFSDEDIDLMRGEGLIAYKGDGRFISFKNVYVNRDGIVRLNRRTYYMEVFVTDILLLELLEICH